MRFLAQTRVEVYRGRSACIPSAAPAGAGPCALLVVTHGTNIQALAGGSNPESAEIVVVAAGADGAIREVGRIPVPER